jgi:DNA-binding CsgD family transcriptional regulator
MPDSKKSVERPPLRNASQSIAAGVAAPVAAKLDPVTGMMASALSLEAGAAPAQPLTNDILRVMHDECSGPRMLLDRDLNIRWTNPAADVALASSDVLRQVQSRLVVEGPDAGVFVRKLAAAGKGCPMPWSLVLRGPEGLDEAEVAAWLRPFPSAMHTSAPLWAKGLVRCDFRELRRPARFDVGLMQRTYGLSEREAGVLVQIVAGASVDEIAEERGVSLETVMTQLKSCMRKTRTHRQSHLVALALALVPPVLEL